MSHWYIIRPDGLAERYKQYDKHGQERRFVYRKQAIADGAVEGVSSIVARCFDQSGLLEWAARLAMDAAFRAVAEKGVGAIDEARALAKDYYADARNAASTKGTEIHEAIERRLKDQHVAADDVERAAQDAVEKWMADHGLCDGKSEHCVYFRGKIAGWPHEIAYGGTIDWIGDRLILDFKTVEADSRGKYWTGKGQHCAQLAAYRNAAAKMGFCAPDATAVNLYIDRKTGGIIAAREWTAKELDAGMEIIAMACRISDLTEEIQ